MIWAAAYGHSKYTIILSGSDNQAKAHLAAIRQELNSNKVLKADFPSLCLPYTWERKAVPEADRANAYRARNGSFIEARSIWSSVLGAKSSDDIRPTLIVLDDVSKGEGTGSPKQTASQRDVLLGTIMPLNKAAPLWSIGTVHMVNSIEDQFIRSTLGEEFDWLKEEPFDVHWIKPIIEREDGSLRSVWSEQWSIEYLQAESTTRTYAKDFLNRPIPQFSGLGWEQADFIVADLPSTARVIISVDPGVSDTGDPTGIAVIGFSLVARKAIVLEAFEARLKGADLKSRLLDLLTLYDATDIVWESNQGGSALAEATLGLNFPARMHMNHASMGKLERAEVLLARYKNKKVVHAKRFPALELQMISFPRFTVSPNILDAVGQGIDWLSKNATSSVALKVGRQ
jgi:hypothetical protein